MENWIIYIMKSSICLALLYLPFWRFLRKETFFFFNRYALLGITALSFILPLINIPEMSPKLVEVEIMPIHWENMEVLAYEGQNTERPIDWMNIVGWIYAAGVLACFIYKMYDLIRLLRFIPTGCLWMEKESGLYIHCHAGKVMPFSWMNHIVISDTDYRENGEAILLHEKAHIACRHSWDVMWLAVVEVLQWFNPFVWMLSNDIQDIHEYEADLSVLRQGVDAKNYQRLIIRKAVSSGSYAFANSFNHSSLKKRITMMMKKKSNPWARAKYLYVLPLATVAIAAFARPEVSNEVNEISSVKVNDLASIVKAEEAKSVENSSKEKIKVSGKVLNAETKKPVPGASVIIRGTTNGTLADFDGHFELQAKKGDVVMVTYVGLQAQSIIVKDNAPLVILMKDDVQSMREMVVMGYAMENSKASEVADVVFDMPLEEAMKAEASQSEVEIFQVVEEMPEFPGGMQKAMEFIGKNIKYPVAAQEAKIEGRVIVQFLIGSKGDVSEVEVVRGVSPELDAEAIRVISMMPKWNPGKQRGKAVNVKFTLPVSFRLSSSENNPLIVVDGEVKGNDPELMKNYTPENIQSMTVVKGDEAIRIYGEKGKGGVILITTKKAASAETVKEKLIFQVVEEMPEFPGGVQEMMNFVSKNMRYPAEAHKNGTQGRVLVKFVVTDKGDIETPTVFESVDPLLDAEALRVIKMMPKWKPGKQRGKAVNVLYTLPVTFRLQ